MGSHNQVPLVVRFEKGSSNASNSNLSSDGFHGALRHYPVPRLGAGALFGC